MADEVLRFAQDDSGNRESGIALPFLFKKGPAVGRTPVRENFVTVKDSGTETPGSPLDPEWARTYRQAHHTYSRVWLVGLIMLVPAGLVIGAFVSGKYTWREGLGSGLFFAAVLFLLTLSMFKKMDKCWKGRVVTKYEKDYYGTRRVGRRRVRVFIKIAYRVEVRTDAGRKEIVDVHKETYKLLQVGDELVKYKGLAFPDLMLRPGETTRICAACGHPFEAAEPQCPVCRFKSPPTRL